MIEAHFENIRNLIKGNIKEAQTDIKIAVAWFTQRELFAEVLEALNRGVEVSMIIIKDFINCGIYGLPLQQFVDAGGKLHFVSNRGWVMHNKFCLFDNSLVITGSYNWTYSAETRNAENVIATDDDNVCSRFNDYFNRLWEESFVEETIPNVEISSEEVIQDFSFIYDELEAMEGKEIIPSGALNILKTTKTTVDVAIANTAKPNLPPKRVEHTSKKEKIVETSILEPICYNGNPIKPSESVLLKTISMPFSSGREWAFGKQGDTLPKYSKRSLCNAEDLTEENDGNIICCNLRKYIDENIGGIIIETYLNEKELLKFDKLPCVPKNKCRFLGKASISKSGLLTFSVYCYNTKETKRVEIQLVEGEDFIIG